MKPVPSECAECINSFLTDYTKGYDLVFCNMKQFATFGASVETFKLQGCYEQDAILRTDGHEAEDSSWRRAL